MTPMTRNIALAAAALVIPAAIAAAAGPDRMRRLPDRMRDLWTDDTSVEGQLKRLTHRLNDLTDDLHLHSTHRDELAQVGKIAAIAGAVLLIPVALAAWIGPDRIREKVREYREDLGSGDDFETTSRFDDLSDDMEDLEDDIEAQREDAFDAVTGAAQSYRG